MRQRRARGALGGELKEFSLSAKVRELVTGEGNGDASMPPWAQNAALTRLGFGAAPTLLDV